MNYRLSLILWFISHLAYAQDQNFAIYHRGSKAGVVHARSWEENGKRHYENKSTVELKMLATLKISYHQSAVFKEDQLLASDYSFWVNGSLHRSCHIRYKNGTYQVENDGNKTQVDDPIHYVAACLLLEEPNGLSQVFSEQYAAYHDIKKTGKNRYLKTATDGKENIYQYQNGILTYAKLDGGLVSFELKRED